MPEKPVGPNVRITVLTSSAIGLFLAGGGAYLLEYLDNTIKKPEDVEMSVDIPVLASIAPIHGEHYKEKLVTVKHPRSPISEAFRSLRTAIQFSTIDRPKNYSILISIPNPTEGKSVTATNLGVVMAQAGYKVLIIDSDLRRPVIHRFFQLPNSQGLTSFLLEVNLNQLESEILFLESKIIHDAPIEGLRILTSGPIPPNPSELLGSEKMRKTIAALKDQYDYIIMDSPPIIVVTDAAVLSTQASGVLLVTEVDKTQRNHLKLATDHLREVNANLIGAVLNRIPLRSDSYYNHYYKDSESYDKSYGYGYSQSDIAANPNGRKLTNILRNILKNKTLPEGGNCVKVL